MWIWEAPGADRASLHGMDAGNRTREHLEHLVLDNEDLEGIWGLAIDVIHRDDGTLEICFSEILRMRD